MNDNVPVEKSIENLRESIEARISAGELCAEVRGFVKSAMIRYIKTRVDIEYKVSEDVENLELGLKFFLHDRSLIALAIEINEKVDCPTQADKDVQRIVDSVLKKILRKLL